MADSIEFDLIICGSGLAGLRAAIAATKKGPNLKIGIVSKLQVMR
ncbi:MAG: FAD-binding protein, partial [Thaumarchaeota archaeon]|nr:FAD-binding protein [Nitrososphaerota archaeon]